MDEIQEHQNKLLDAFAAVLRIEERVSDVKRRQEEATILLQNERNRTEADLDKAWVRVAEIMAETGEPEVVLPGEVTDFKIAWSKARERVKVEPDAVPDEFCKIERKPRLKEIGEFLHHLQEQGLSLPNWARFEAGESKLTWKAVKKLTRQEKI